MLGYPPYDPSICKCTFTVVDHGAYHHQVHEAARQGKVLSPTSYAPRDARIIDASKNGSYFCSGCTGRSKCFNMMTGMDCKVSCQDDVVCCITEEENSYCSSCTKIRLFLSETVETEVEAEKVCIIFHLSILFLLIVCMYINIFTCIFFHISQKLRLASLTTEERHHIHELCDKLLPDVSHASIDDVSSGKCVLVLQRQHSNKIGTVALCSVENAFRKYHRDTSVRSDIVALNGSHGNGEKCCIYCMGDTGHPSKQMACVNFGDTIIGDDGNHCDDTPFFCLFTIVGNDRHGNLIPENKVDACRRWNLNGMVLLRFYAKGPNVIGAVGAEDHR